MSLTVFVVAILILFTPVQIQPSNARPDKKSDRSREEFSAAVRKVEKGMPESDVLALLGKPDDVITRQDRKAIHTIGTNEIWCYGADSHLAFPTLGRVYIDGKGKVQHIIGKGGTPPKSGLIEEAQLRSILRMIRSAPVGVGNSDALRLIQAVNGLQRLGKDKAWAAIDEYVRVCSELEDEGNCLMPLMRVLFDVPDASGWMPPMFYGPPLGETHPMGPKDRKSCPRFPIILVKDVPVCVVWSYMQTGPPIEVENYVNLYRKHHHMRRESLSPPDNPLTVLDQMWKTDRFVVKEIGPTERELCRVLIMKQLVQLLSSVYKQNSKLLDAIESGNSNAIEAEWKNVTRTVEELGIRWDSKKCDYRLEVRRGLRD